ncbi:nickel-dependent hydrogenase large subunit [Thiolapillus sp.]
MGLEGSISIDLQLDGFAVAEVAIASRRPVHASRVLEGKPADEALGFLGMLFSVCGTAQSCAGVRACEQALDHVEAPMVAARRNLMVQLESLREHLWRLFLDWPPLQGEEEDGDAMQKMLRLHAALSGMLDPQQDLFRISGSVALVDDGDWQRLTGQLSALVQERVFAQSPESWLELADVQELDSWAGRTDTFAARLLRGVRERRWAAAGRCSVEALPDLDGCALARYFDYQTFVETPLWHGQPRETSAFTRVNTPLTAALQADFGNGLLPRLVARLSEMAQLCQELQAFRFREAPQPACLARSGMGLGQVEAARGRLIHQIVLEEQQITRYRILAPTEWNFHPKGVVAQGLAALTGTEAQIREQARLLISAIDPCVAYELNLHG